MDIETKINEIEKMLKDESYDSDFIEANLMCLDFDRPLSDLEEISDGTWALQDQKDACAYDIAPKYLSSLDATLRIWKALDVELPLKIPSNPKELVLLAFKNWKYKNNPYNKIISTESENDTIPVDEFIRACENNEFIDNDGFGHPAKDGKLDDHIYIFPSQIDDIPDTATHIVWYNK